MDSPGPYANFHVFRTSGPTFTSPPSLPPDGCLCTRRRQLPLKFSCVALILLILNVIGFSVSGRPALLKCPKGWYILQDKCLFFSQTVNPWNESLADCSANGGTLLLIQDREEWRVIKYLSSRKGRLFWIGLKYALSENIWKWINGSNVNSDIFTITGISEENSCGLISWEHMISDDCHADNYWICQKKLKPV